MSLWSCELGAGDTYDIVIDWRRVMALLESGQVGDVNEICYGMTILYQAVARRKLAAIKALLRHGADINLGRQARSSHFEVVAAMTPLMCAAINGHDDCIAALVRGGADVNYCTPADGTFGPCNALQRAVSVAAGGFEKYGRARRAPFVAMLDRGLSLPRDAIYVICEFWLRVGEYNQHTNLFLRFC